MAVNAAVWFLVLICAYGAYAFTLTPIVNSNNESVPDPSFNSSGSLFRYDDFTRYYYSSTSLSAVAIALIILGWMRKFRVGRQSFEDLLRVGRLKEAMNEKIIGAVRELIRENPHVTVQMKMHWAMLLSVCLVSNTVAVNHHKADIEDNEFAEFEEFDDEEEIIIKETDTKLKPDIKTTVSPPQNDDDEVQIEEEGEEEFDHFQDEEEFEGLDQEIPLSKGKPSEKPDLKITKVPLHLRRNWESFYLEFLMIAGLLVYFINFIAGRNKNQKLAMAWFNSHKQMLDTNFALVGDDGKKEIETPGIQKESENVYTLWCSGRVCVEGMLVELKFLKRQDLVSVMSNMLRPASDQIVVKVTMSADSMDNFIFCIANKKTANKLVKDMNDLSTYCPEKKTAERHGVPESFIMMSELGEAASAMLDNKLITVLQKYQDCIDFIHFSDQFSGPKQQEDSQPTKLPDTKKVLMFGFNVPGRGKITSETMENMKPLLQLVFYSIEKVKRFHLSKEAKIKAEKNRQRVEEAFLKTTHAQRQEAAQQRREERRRAEKERMMNEEDPEKQRKWEEREHRRELKKRAPKMKQLKQ